MQTDTCLLHKHERTTEPLSSSIYSLIYNLCVCVSEPAVYILTAYESLPVITMCGEEITISSTGINSLSDQLRTFYVRGNESLKYA